MHRHTKRKLTLDRDTLRQLATPHLEQARGGGSELQTCSMCAPPLAGCHTANNC